MNYRIDRVIVKLSVHKEFSGHYDIDIDYVPESNDDPLVQMLLAKYRVLLEAQIRSDNRSGTMLG
jgi:hypothetical protein